jgi:hypothetical protein
MSIGKDEFLIYAEKSKVSTDSFPDGINLFDLLSIDNIINCNLSDGICYVSNREITSNKNLKSIINTFNQNEYIKSIEDNNLKSIIKTRFVILAIYGNSLGLEKQSIKYFTDLGYVLLFDDDDEFDNSINHITLNLFEKDILNKLIDFLPSLSSIGEGSDEIKIKILLDFLFNQISSQQTKKKSVTFTYKQIEEINNIDGKGFCGKVRNVIDEYFRIKQKEIKKNKKSLQSLNPEKIYNHNNVNYFEYNDKKFRVKNWVDLLIKLIVEISKQNHYNLEEIFKLNNKKTFFSTVNVAIEDDPFLIPNTDIYIERNLGYKDIDYLIASLIDIFNLEQEYIKYL